MDYLNDQYLKMWATVEGPEPIPEKDEKEELILYVKLIKSTGNVEVTLLYKNVFKNSGHAYLFVALDNAPTFDTNYNRLGTATIKNGQHLENVDYRLLKFVLPQLSQENLITTLHLDIHKYPTDDKLQKHVTELINELCLAAQQNAHLFAVQDIKLHITNINTPENIQNVEKLMNQFGAHVDFVIARAKLPLVQFCIANGMKFNGATGPLTKNDFDYLINVFTGHGNRVIRNGAAIKIFTAVKINKEIELKWLGHTLSTRGSFNASRFEIVLPPNANQTEAEKEAEAAKKGESCFYPLRGCPDVGYFYDTNEGTLVAAQKFKRVCVELDKEFGLASGMPYELRLKAKTRVLFHFNQSYSHFNYKVFDEPHILQPGQEITLKEYIRPFVVLNKEPPKLVFTYFELSGGCSFRPRWIKGLWMGAEVPLTETPFEVSTRVISDDEAETHLQKKSLPCRIQ
ncbi:hypothetical protein QR680_000905 [Steinernema hermaphroditum]|uniref:Uncharacterized protein n=1 Tax=Steinernema hermaphroditum TaxID=289476 RepID=A0AA39GWE5_9BILA|nr:hypothetical protein QR680_000905 [Steinernema hermaphroditum]